MNLIDGGHESISVIILTKDRKGALQKCLDSVFGQNVKPCQVIVIDNASNDGTVDFLKRYPANLEIIANSVNLGFGKAMNQGIKEAAGCYALLLSADIILNPDYLEIMLAYIKNNKDAGIVSGYLYNYYTKELIFSGTKAYFHWKFRQDMLSVSSIPIDTELIPGAMVFAKTALLKELNGFDERYFFYFEDLDLTLRFEKLGYRNLIIPQASAYHMERDSGIKKYSADSKIQFELEKNILLTYFKHANLFWLGVFFIRYMAHILIMNIFDTNRNNIILKSRWWAVCNLIDLFRARYR